MKCRCLFVCRFSWIVAVFDGNFFCRVAAFVGRFSCSVVLFVGRLNCRIVVFDSYVLFSFDRNFSWSSCSLMVDSVGVLFLFCRFSWSVVL